MPISEFLNLTCHRRLRLLIHFYLCFFVVGLLAGHLAAPILADTESSPTGCDEGVTPECLAEFSLADSSFLEPSHWRGLAHVAIASAQLELGNFEGVKVNLEKAFQDVAGERNPFNRVEVLIEISVVLAEFGDVEAAEHNIAQALLIADGITLPDWRYWALSFVPRPKAKTCAFVEAKEIIGESLVSVKIIGDMVARASASTHIASAQLEIGDRLGAMRTIERILGVVSKISDVFWKTDLLSQVALLQAKAGDIEGAEMSIAESLAIAEEIEGSWRYWRLAQISLVQAQIGEGFIAVGRIQELANVLQGDKDDKSLAGWRTFAFAYLSKALAIIETRAEGRVPASELAARLCA